MEAVKRIWLNSLGNGGYHLTWDEDPRTESQLVLLVHGYNTTAASASANFSELLGRAARRWVLPPGFREKVWHVDWPGYAADFLTGGSASVASGGAYPGRIGVAKACGYRLGEFLTSLRSEGQKPVEVTLVGHSMGCRLIVEALQYLAVVEANVVVRLVFLMAAAVPIGLVAEGSWHRQGAEIPRARWVLHSPDDAVLHYLFPLGQTVVPSEIWYGDEAVGRFGRPHDGVWTERRTTFNGHSDYFRDGRTTDAFAEAVGGVYWRVVRDRIAENRRLREAATVVRVQEGRGLPEYRKLA